MSGFTRLTLRLYQGSDAEAKLVPVFPQPENSLYTFTLT